MKKLLLILTLVVLLTAVLSACVTGENNDETTVADATTASDETVGEATTAEETTVEETTQEEITTEEATTEEATTEEITTEEETTIMYAGTDSGLTRDGKPKKYFTLSFDDGITQDLKIIEILKKYNVDCISFNINTGLYGANWEWVGKAIGNPSVTHKRFTKAELETGIYNGYDVCVHTLNHPSLKNYDKNVKTLKKEVGKDAENIYKLTGIMPVGMAWPGGDTEYTETTIKLVLENTDIRFARGTTATYKFDLPTYFMQWMPTCSITDASVLTLADKFIKAECTEDMIFYVWGHGYELDAGNLYGTLEKLIEKMVNAGDEIVLVTNSEFYQLFKDEIPAWKE